MAAVVLAAGTAAIAVADHGNNNNNNNNNNNGEVRLRTNLSGAAIQGKTPEGNADFRNDSNKMRLRLKVEVENVNLPSGTVLDVTIMHAGAATVAGHITLSAGGESELELDSQNGDVVPAIVTGDMIVVSNAGTAILSGVF